MRTLNSLKNLLVSLGLGAVAIVVGFVVQKIFIDQLSIEYLGMHGLFTNIITMLGVAELGLGSAIVYHLYQPLADKDYARINPLMRFYKIAYRGVASIVFLIGVLLMPLLPIITSNAQLPINIYIVFALFVLDAVLSYLMSYKRSILYADQKNYIINMVKTGGVVFFNTAQIVSLILFQNYFLFLLIKITATILENVILSRMINKRYPMLKSDAQTIDDATRSDIIVKAKGLLFHKIGTFAVLGTDNLVISIFFGVKLVGIYSNYLLVISALNAIFSQLTTALTASVGNLLLEKNIRKQEGIFSKIYFANAWISIITSVGFFATINPFIEIWVGSEYLLPTPVVIALTISLYLTLLRMPIQTFKTAAGIFHEDRLMPIIESAINLALSILFLHIFGVLGVFLGTICSTLFLHIYSYPKYTYSKLFLKPWRNYWRLLIETFVMALSIFLTTYLIIRTLSFESPLITLIINLFIALTVSTASLTAIYRKTDEFRYFRQLIINLIIKKGGLANHDTATPATPPLDY